MRNKEEKKAHTLPYDVVLNCSLQRFCLMRVWCYLPKRTRRSLPVPCKPLRSAVQAAGGRRDATSSPSNRSKFQSPELQPYECAASSPKHCCMANKRPLCSTHLEQLIQLPPGLEQLARSVLPHGAQIHQLPLKLLVCARLVHHGFRHLHAARNIGGDAP